MANTCVTRIVASGEKPDVVDLINIYTAIISSMMLGNPGPDGYDAEWESAAMFLENRGGIGSKSRGYIIKQSVIAVHAIVDAIIMLVGPN